MSCRSAKQGYQVCSRTSVEAVEGGSVTLPCTFSYPAHLQPSRVAVSWRSDMFRDSTVFQSTDGFVRESLKGRLSQKGDLDKRDASIFIRDIRIDDFKVYVCQVMVFDDKAGYEFHVSDRIELKLGIRCKSQGELSCRSTRLGYQVCAQTSVEAVEGGSAMLPCTFSYPAHLPPSRVSVSWRPEGFHEAIMFQSADPFLRENVLGDGGGGRFSLAGNLSTRNASISIRDLRLDDFKAYVCQLVMYYVNKENVFQVSDPIKLKLKAHRNTRNPRDNDDGSNIVGSNIVGSTISSRDGSIPSSSTCSHPLRRHRRRCARLGGAPGAGAHMGETCRVRQETPGKRMVSTPAKAWRSMIAIVDDNKIGVFGRAVTKGALCQSHAMPSCRCSTDGYRVCVKTFVEAEEGSSVVLPCSFSYPAHSPPSRVTVSWKSDMFRDRIVFQSADGFVRESLKGRLSLVGDLNKNDASISIRDVNINDFKSYTCQPVLYYENRDRVVQVSDAIDLDMKGKLRKISFPM
ncbi:unnamed protein product [Lampetra fluviatilis]